MSDNPRKAEAAFKFNGKNVTKTLKNYLESVKYTDVASGSSDQLDIQLQNINANWLGKWYPTKGDKVVGSFIFHNWKKDGKDLSLPLGKFTMDDIRFSGGPMTAQFGCVAVPNDESFRVRERTKTWKGITIQGIAQEIASRYGLSLKYSAPTISINELEQSDKTDCAFLFDLCDKYGISMKVYAGQIAIYDQGAMERKKSIATLKRTSFVDDHWDFTDTLAGIYTGARISYKSGKDSEEISIYLGFQAEDAPGSRVLRISETADSVEDAYYKAAAKVNKSNQGATTISADIFPNPKICAGVTVKVTGMGKANGKYFVDKSTITVGESATKQSIEMHKCQRRLVNTAVPTPPAASPSAPAAKSYKEGDIVQFKGGTHYVSSYAGAKGYNAKPGPAKITHDPTCKGNGGAHPWHLVHTDKTSNVYGWVDEGTFS